MSLEGSCAYVARVEGHFVLAINDSEMITLFSRCLGDEKTAQAAAKVFATNHAITYKSTLVQPDRPIMTIREVSKPDLNGLVQQRWYPTIICSAHKHEYIAGNNSEGAKDKAFVTSQMLAADFEWDFLPDFQITCNFPDKHHNIHDASISNLRYMFQPPVECDILSQIDVAMLLMDSNEVDVFEGLDFPEDL